MIAHAHGSPPVEWSHSRIAVSGRSIGSRIASGIITPVS
jgi:hypothetical protein